jgi:hypothetical protein
LATPPNLPIRRSFAIVDKYGEELSLLHSLNFPAWGAPFGAGGKHGWKIKQIQNFIVSHPKEILNINFLALILLSQNGVEYLFAFH